MVIPGVPVIRARRAARCACRAAWDRGSRSTGKPVPTKVTGTFADLLNGRPMQFTACRAVTLAAGTNQVTEPHSDAFDVQDVVLDAVRGRWRRAPRARERTERPAAAATVTVLDARRSGRCASRRRRGRTWR